MMHKLATLVTGLAFAMEVAQSATVAVRPPQKTTGTAVPPPDLTGKPHVVTGALDSIAVPLAGWLVKTPMDVDKMSVGNLSVQAGTAKADDAAPAETILPGIRVIGTNAVVRGRSTPALRIEYTRGAWKRGFCWIEVPFALNANAYNLLSFEAKIEVPADLTRCIGDSRELLTGWFASHFHQWHDNFALAIADGNGYVNWASHGVFTTDFRNHDYRGTRGPDGFADFGWDMCNEEHSSYKGCFRRRGEAIQLLYDTRKNPRGRPSS